MKGNCIKLLKKYCNFIILIYCHYVINIFNSLIDIPDIHYLLLIHLFNNYITNIFIKCINLNINLNNIKSIINEGCSIVLDYIIISKEEKFNNTNYIPKFTDALQFSYQKIMYKIENTQLENKNKKKYKKSPIIKKKSNKQNISSKVTLQNLYQKNNNYQNNNYQNNNYHNNNYHNNKKDTNIPIQYTSKFKNIIYKCIEFINILFINLVKILFINYSNSMESNILFNNLAYFLDDVNELKTDFNDNKDNNDFLNNNNDTQLNNNYCSSIISNTNTNNDKIKGMYISNFFDKLSFNIDIIENYLLLLTNEIVPIFKENKYINYNNIINNVNLAFKKINEIQITEKYSQLCYNLIYLIYPYLFIKNINKLQNIYLSYININEYIINWCIQNNNWLIQLYLTQNDKIQIINNNNFNKINQKFKLSTK